MPLGDGQPTTPPLAGFVLALLRALAKDSQYGSDHPQAAQAAVGAWEALGEASGRRHAVTVRQVGSAAAAAFEIRRHPEAARDLASLLPRTNRDRLLDQLRDAFAGAGIRRLTILPACPREALALGLATLGECTRGGAGDASDHVQVRLLDRGVHQVLALGAPTLGMTRSLPRDVAEHLEILRAVVNRLAVPDEGERPMAPHALAEVGAALVGLLPETEDVRQLLVSLDLAVEAVEPDRKRRVLDALVRGLARPRAGDLLARCEEVVERHGGPSLLGTARDERGAPLMGYFIAAQALRRRLEAPTTRRRPRPSPSRSVRREAGPPPLHPRVDEWLAQYEAIGPSLLRRLERPGDDEQVVGAATILGHVGARLVADRRYAQVQPILRALKAAERAAVGRSGPVREALEEAVHRVIHPSRTARLVADYPKADVVTRDALFELLAAQGRAAIPALVRSMVERPGDPNTLREMAALVEDVGADAGPALVTALEAHGSRWGRVLPLVRLLGAIRYRRGEPLLAGLTGHAEAQVRLEALFALFHMLGSDAEHHLLRALDDAHPEVRQRAIALLALDGCTAPRYLRTLQDLLTRAGDAGGDGLVVSAVHALARLGNVRFPDGADAETLLSAMLEGSVGSGLLRFVSGPRGPRISRSAGTLGAVCEALATLGGDRARDALGHASRVAPPAVQDRARAALARLSGP
ncbi:MAG: hypothetical protein ACQEXJ_01090 [Myxococcota bacterium]